MSVTEPSKPPSVLPSVLPSVPISVPPTSATNSAAVNGEGSFGIGAAASLINSGNGGGGGGGAAVVDDFYNFNNDNDDGNFYYDDYDNGTFEEDELWEEWQDEEAMAAAAEVEREREEKERREKEQQQQQGGGHGGGPRRRNIIMSQSPGSTQPLAVGAVVHQHPIGSDNSSLPSSIGQQQQQQQQQRWQGEEQNRGLTRLRKAGNAAGDRERQIDNLPNINEEEGGGGNRRAPAHQQQQQQQRQRHGPSVAAARFLDTEAQLSGDDSDGNEDGDLDGYESDFIDDGTQGADGIADREDGSGGGGGDGGGSQEGGSLATPRDHASLAAFHYRRLHEERNSPSPGSLLRRLQQARLGRRGGVAGGSVSNTPLPAGGIGYAGGLSAPYGSDDYDREDSFIDDGDDDEEGEGFDTPAGRDSHSDACGGCGECDGELLLCDACPAAFHLGCVGLREVPVGDWFCPICADSNTPQHLAHGGGIAPVAQPKNTKVAVPPPPAAAAGGLNKSTKPNMPKKPTQSRPRNPPPAAAQPPAAAGPPDCTALNNKRPLLDSDSDDDFA
jgi:hypothetical protein